MIHVHTVVRDEAYLLPYFLRHYATVADHIFVLDDGSTDGSQALVSACPIATLLPYPFTTGLDDRVLHEALNASVATHSRGVAEWVLCPDVDEFLYIRRFRAVLTAIRSADVRALVSTAYFMVAEAPPETSGQLYEVVTQGVRPRRTSARYSYDKTLIFDPGCGVELGPGRHHTVVPANVPIADVGIKLLHFCYLGRAYIEARIRRNCARMLMLSDSERDTMCAYRISRALREFDAMRAHAGPVV